MSSVPVEQIDDLNFLGGIFQEMETAFNEADYSKTLDDFNPEIAEAQGEHFSGRHDSGGSLWPALSAYTIAKKGHDVPLVETGRLKASVLDFGHPDHIEAVSHRGLLFGTEVPYGIFHQEGTKKIPRRAFLGLKEELLQKIVDGVADHAVETLKYKV